MLPKPLRSTCRNRKAQAARRHHLHLAENTSSYVAPGVQTRRSPLPHLHPECLRRLPAARCQARLRTRGEPTRSGCPEPAQPPAPRPEQPLGRGAGQSFATTGTRRESKESVQCPASSSRVGRTCSRRRARTEERECKTRAAPGGCGWGGRSPRRTTRQRGLPGCPGSCPPCRPSPVPSRAELQPRVLSPCKQPSAGWRQSRPRARPGCRRCALCAAPG